MKHSFYVVDMPTRDMISDQLPIEDIIAVTKFQTAIACGASIESLSIVDFTQEVEEQKIITMIYVDAVVNGESFMVIFSTDNDEIVKAVLTFSRSVESNNRVMQYVRSTIE